MNIAVVLSFVVLVLAARQIGTFFTRFRLPLVTGYLVTGIVVGPFVLNMIPHENVEDLVFIDEVSLAMIAFIAGSELYLKELRSRLRSIAIILTCLSASVFLLGSVALLLLADFIPFMQEMAIQSRIAVAIIGGSILIARSPSSAIAVINELRARGPYTKLVLGVTVAMDMVVIIVFALSASVADALLTGIGFDLTFLGVILIELVLSLTLGFIVSRFLRAILGTTLSHNLKIVLIALLGFVVFEFSKELRHFTAEMFSVELLLEPLLISLLGSFFVTNYSPYRVEFTDSLHEVGPLIYVFFFTLTGVSLELDVVADTWAIMIVLFVVRLIGIAVGTFSGGVIAGEPMRYNRVSWMSFVTQAGVGLGLAKEVAVEFSEFGAEFATMIISVIVINEIVGPPFFKEAIKRVGEANVPPRADPDVMRDVVIMGVSSQAIALARQLRSHDWKVTLFDTDESMIERCERVVADEDIQVKSFSEISAKQLGHLMSNKTDAVVAMFTDDERNYQVSEIALEKFGIPRRIVRINDPSWTKRFQQLGVQVVDPTSAMVNVLDTSVRSPQSAELLISQDSEYDTVQVTITDRDVVGLAVRDLHLPDDVLILGIRRRKQWIMPHGYTILRWNDEVTFLGKPESLAEVQRRFGY